MKRTTRATPYPLMMFAVKRHIDQTPIWVKVGEDGFWECQPQDMEAWASLYTCFSETIKHSALSASMFGWDTPAAQTALEAARGLVTRYVKSV